MGIKISGSSAGGVKIRGTGAGGIKISNQQTLASEWTQAYYVNFASLPPQNFKTTGDGYHTIDGKYWYVWGTDNSGFTVSAGISSNGLLIDLPQTGYGSLYAGAEIPWATLVPGLDLASKEIMVFLRLTYVPGAPTTSGGYNSAYTGIFYQDFNPADPNNFNSWSLLSYGKNQDYNNYDRGTIVYGYYPGDYAARSPNPDPLDWSMGMHLTHFNNTLVGSFYSSPFDGTLPSDTSSMNLERSINRSLTLSGFENFRIGWTEYDGRFPVACKELRIMYK